MPRNIAEFRIIGNVGTVDKKEKVTYVNVAANYNRKVDDEWETDTHWNKVTLFGRSKEAADKANKGDLIYVTGRMKQNSYEKEGQTHYNTDMIADSFSVLTAANGDDE